MSRRLDVINLDDPVQRPAPKMMSSCESGGCGGGPEPALPPPPTFGEVRINGVEIPPEAIAQEIQHHPAPDAETAWVEAARALAVRELLLQESQRLGVEAEPGTDESGRFETSDDATIRALLENEVVANEPDESECLRYYEANKDRFRTAELFEAAHILIEPEGAGDDAWETSRARACAIIKNLGDSSEAFAAAAREHSSCPSAKQDGSLGQIRRGELVPEVQAGIEVIPEGCISTEPVRSRYGWHILRLHRRIPGRTIPFDMARERIADMLEARSWSVAAARYVAALAEQNDVEGIRIEASA